MKEFPLINNFGTRFGTEYLFSSEDELYQFMYENWPDGQGLYGDLWSQNHFTVGAHPIHPAVPDED